MKEIDISDLMGIWFHEVKVNHISIDYLKREVAFECVIPIGFWNSPNRYGLTNGEIKFTLLLTGLLFLSMEPPDANYPYEDSVGIEINSEGSVTPEKFASYLSKMPQDLPEEAFLHYFYVSEWNTFIFIAATDVLFQDKIIVTEAFIA